MKIRDERASDVEAITRVTIAAFENHPISRQTEHFIVLALRRAGALSVSLVAEEAGEVVGHIAFSRVAISDGTPDWYGMGPVSVVPECQRRGIGSGLVKAGLERLRTLHGGGCALVGPPEYYQRFGFVNVPALVHEGIPQEYFLCLSFVESVPAGTVTFDKAFMAAS